MFKTLAIGAAFALALAPAAVYAAGGGEQHIEDFAFSFEGPFGTYDQNQLQRGLQIYTEVCAACHGVDGKGNPMLGAPNLTDDIWLYGSDAATIKATIENGRQGQMPAFSDRLGQEWVRLLAAYAMKLSESGS